MNNTTKRSRVLYIVIIAFLVGLTFMMFAFYVNGSKWTANQANQHIYKNGQLTSAGTIYDKNGTALVSTKDGKRVYNSDSTIRKATLHAVGDNSSFISTGVQYLYGSGLSGYNFLNGVYSLKKYDKGNDLYLTLDADICKTAYNAMDGRKGTVAAYNYRTGEIICMVSTPTYDPENKPDDIEGNSKYEGVYLNRFLSGQYTPGSIFKVVTAISALENIPDINTQTFNCDGTYETGDGKVECNGVHYDVNFEEALNNSCNSAFADIALQLGGQRLTETAEKLGFNKSMSIDKINITKSTLDVSKANRVDLGWAGIGQYTT
ncbi:MAG: penicillin-binding protein, partial [Ruminococcus sp.]|nr:penicillin-binding protein [Candidatus Copronaster equi]